MLPGGGLQQDRFPTVRKGGYDKAHVDDYYVRMDNQFKSIRERLQRMDDELEQYKRDLAIAREKAQVKPEHEQISARMAEILRIAEEEAKERRSKVESEVKEIEKTAQEEIAKHRKDAEEHAERIVSSARAEAHEMVSGAKQEADQLREQAKQEGDRRLGEAEARAKKIHDTADRRLATLTATHAEALRRLKDMHSTLADLVEAEDKAGALEAGLSREDASGPAAEQRPAAARPAAKPAPKPAGPGAEGSQPVRSEAAQAARAVTPETGPGTRPAPEQKPEQKDEATTKLPPLQQGTDQATVRIKPVIRPDQADQAGPKAVGGPQEEGAKGGGDAGSAPRPPQGARFTGPAPDGPQGRPQAQSGQQAQAPAGDAAGGDPGITGVYRRPESGQSQPPSGDEGVRVIRKP
ncbi:cell division protein DivIVA [Nocardiopsis tropica]|uniref:Cell division protein DivIVA n=1 Tax=Nocardiopsis tropica TaxID=109330 RepID=A0ABU7KVT3_9ACTN|nr:cell division protein DivIVA [Nocardiopsis umidischolae]MEE2053114.1 cell division protein DivIVA [Nocardiopsis umidischolae]